MIHIAIIGSGPTGCFVAEFLAKKHDAIQIDIFERLPTPFGLVRAGVAPDHQQTKRITQQLERTLQRDNVRFIGNVTIGQHLSYESLKQHYHSVVIATGAFSDRPLPQNHKSITGIYGSAAFAGWYNSHPDHCQTPPVINGPTVAIIGNGNVALDIARILAKSDAELTTSDINPDALCNIRAANLTDIYLIGRRGAENASFTNMELAELGQLQQCSILTDINRLPTTLPDAADAGHRRAMEQNLQTLQAYGANSPIPGQVRLHLMFNYSLATIQSQSGQLESITLTDNSGLTDPFTLQTKTLITAIGYTCAGIEGVPFDTKQNCFSHQEGLIESGVYCAGWCKRGPQGVIPTNRSDATATAKRILADLAQNTDNKTGFLAISPHLSGHRWVSFGDWEVLNTAEQALARDERPRTKLTSIEQMLALLP